jgi:heterodisulfide reductase subunit C
MPIDILEITPDPPFLHEVEEASGEDISTCYQCKKCTNGCPVVFAMDLFPHKLIHMVQLGLREEVLNSSTIWLCAACETCTTRCPNEIDIAKLMDSLGQIALKSGITPKEKNSPRFHSAFLSSIRGRGRVYELGMIGNYTAKSGDLARKIKSGELLKDARLGWKMFKRGKLRLIPSKIHQVKEIKDRFKKAGEKS